MPMMAYMEVLFNGYKVSSKTTLLEMVKQAIDYTIRFVGISNCSVPPRVRISRGFSTSFLLYKFVY